MCYSLWKIGQIMNKSISKIRITKLFNGIVFFFLLCLNSCENFLDNENIKDDILGTIEYNNAPECTVLLKAPNGYGEFYPDGEKTFKVGYATEVQFTVNQEKYSFRKLEAVSKSDSSKSLSDCVSFTTLSSDEKKGIYKIDVKVLKSTNDLLIRPDCYLLPAVSSSYPVNDNTSYPQDTSIKIYFNKAVNLNDFKDTNGYLKNISIKNEDIDLLDTQNGKTPYYKDPYLMDGGKTLVIPIVTGNYLVKDNQTKDITVTLNLNGLKDAVEGEHALFPQTSYTFSFTVNSAKDSSLPELKTLNIARTREDAINGTNLISLDEFTHYAAKANYNGDSSQVAANIKNHHVNKVWVYFEAEDSDSGAAYLEVKEQLVRDTLGNIKYETIYDKNNTETNCIRNISDDNDYSGCFEYDFKSNSDGVARLQFNLFDYSGNSVTKTVDFVKDTVCSFEMNITSTVKESVEDFENSELITYPIVIRLPDTILDTIYIKDLDGNEYLETIYSDDENDFSKSVKVESVEYGYDENNLTVVYLTSDEYWTVNYDSKKSKYYKNLYKVPILINPNREEIIKVNISDTIGNINTIIQKTYVVPDVISYTIHSEAGNTIITPVLSYYPDLVGYQIYKINENGEKEDLGMTSSYSYPSNKYDNQPETIYFLARAKKKAYHGNERFWSYYGRTKLLKKTNGTWSFGDVSINSLSQNDIPSFEVSISQPKVDSSGVRTVKIKYDKNFKFNDDYLYYIKIDDKCYTNNEIILKSRTEPYTLSVIVANKQGEYIESNSQTIDLSYDNSAPEIYMLPKWFVNGGIFVKCNSLKDEGSSGLKKINEQPLVQYLILSDTSNIPRSITEWKKNPNVKTAKYVNDDVYFLESYDTFPKVILYYTEDNNGNGKIESKIHEAYNNPSINIVNFNTSITYINDTFVYSFDPSIDKNGVSVAVINQYIHNGKWIDITEVNNTVIQHLDANKGESSSFLRTIPMHSYVSSSTPVYRVNNVPFYYYPPYIKARDTGNPMVCDLKDLFIGQAGINILADQPCFVHTLYCPNKLADSPEAWLNGGVETGLVMKQKSFTYSYENLSGVPDGYYYTTIVHFADGTMLMTDVKKM